MTYKPVQDNVLVELITEEEKKIISAEPDDIVRAQVISIGDGMITISASNTDTKMERVPVSVNPKSIVHFNKNNATQLPFINEKTYVLNQNYILVIEEGK